jgi:putative hemolysin
VLIEIVALVILILLSGFFSGSEIALFSLSDIKVRKLLRQRRRGARTLRKIKDDPHRLLVTILIGNNLVNVAAAGIATILAVRFFHSTGLGIATGVMTFLLLVFGEITPKSFCYHNAERISLLVARPLYILTKVLYPVIVFIEAISKGILKVLGGRRKLRTITEEEIMTALSMGAEAGVIERDEEKMISNIFEFGDTKVKEVMTPRKRIVAIRSDMRLIDVLTKMLESRYTRIPVYENSFDNMIGVIHIKSLLKYVKRKQFDMDLEKLITPVLFTNEDKKLDLLLDDFRETGTHMAIVTNKKGEVRGLVTLEDLLEEIIGEIYDESDTKRTNMRFIDERTMIVEAETPLKHIDKVMGTDLETSKLNTIADLVVNKLGRMPRKGERIRMKKFNLIVKDVSGGKIKRIKIVKSRGKLKV